MTHHPPNQLNLVADIGGTNTRVALAKGDCLLPKTQTKYSNREFSSLDALLKTYIAAQGGVDCAGACVAVAGPVRDGVGHMTNLDWSIDRTSLAATTQAETLAILNDLQAQGHALKGLDARAITPLIDGPTPPDGAANLVVGIGTGFNSAVVMETPMGCLVPPSESGHADLPVQTAEDLALADFIRSRHRFCAIDGVLSGRGLERLYLWHSQNTGHMKDQSAAQIMQAVAQGSDPLATAAARHFTHLAAVVISNLALVHLPFGGIFLAGGVARSVAPFLLELGFEQSFRNKGRFGDFMANFSVSVIEDDAAALIGCARFLGA